MIIISRAGTTDLEAILALQQLAYRSEALLYDDWTLPALTQTPASLADEFDRLHVFKAVSGARIVGSVRAGSTEGRCEIGRLIVHPDFQRLGIGSRLLSTAEKAFPEASCYELFTGNLSTGNIALYERHHYVRNREVALSNNLLIVYLEKIGPGPRASPDERPSWDR